MKRALMASILLLAAIPTAGATTSGAGRDSIDGIVVHAISGPACSHGQLAFSGASGDAERWRKFFDHNPFLGIHYVVDRDGVVLASTPEHRVANHTLDNNDTTIGIELVHDGNGEEPFGAPQIEALIALITSIRSRYNVPVENIVGHNDVDARTFKCGGAVYKTKMDPGANFPWSRVRAALRGEPSRLVSGPKPAMRPAPAPRRDFGAFGEGGR